LGAGFDVFSVALESPCIEVKFTPAEVGTRTIIIEGAHASEINTDPDLNPSGKALSALSDEFGKPEGYVLRIGVGIPPGKGLGLSGAEAVGAIVCADRYFNLGVKGRALVNIAAKAEPSHHMDNVSASALGGFNIVTQDSFREIGPITFPPPKDLGLAVLVPNVEKPSTEAARQLVPSQVQRAEYVRSIGHAARVSAAFAKGDVRAILEALPWDTIVEPARADGGAYGKGIGSGFLLAEKKILLEKFHVAETISGAGPSRALWYSISEDIKRRRKDKMGTIEPAIALVTDRLRSLGHEVLEVFRTRPSSKGATII
jgi:homoserine kinase